MTALDHRRARAHAYGLLSRLVLRGAEPEVLAEAQRTAGIRESFVDAGGPEALAADHFEIFGMLAPPYAAAFLAEGPEEGAEIVEAIRSACAGAGFTPRLTDVTPDHAGILLAFLSFAEHAIADALEDGQAAVARHLEALVAAVLDRWVLSWVPVWVAAGSSRGGPWAEVVALVGAFVAAHRAALPHPVCASARSDRASGLLDDPRTDLRALAEHLACPRRAGGWLTRADIAELGRRHGAPAGFGPRRLLLQNVLQNAAAYGEIPALARALAGRFCERAGALAATSVDPELLRGWQSAATDTVRMLQRMAEVAEEQPRGVHPTHEASP